MSPLTFLVEERIRGTVWKKMKRWTIFFGWIGRGGDGGEMVDRGSPAYRQASLQCFERRQCLEGVDKAKRVDDWRVDVNWKRQRQ